MGRWQYNPPPNWPQPEPGWMPPPGWAPDPAWGAPPPRWPVWLRPSGRRAMRPVLVTVLLVAPLVVAFASLGTYLYLES